jgi:hypothetical protein
MAHSATVPGPWHAGPFGTVRFASQAWRAVPTTDRAGHGPTRPVWPSIVIGEGRLAGMR